MLDVSRWRMPLFFSWFSQSLNPSSVPSAELRAPLCTWTIGHAGMLSAFLAPLHSLKIPVAGWPFAGRRGERCRLWYDFSSLRVFSRDLVWSHRRPGLGISILLFFYPDRYFYHCPIVLQTLHRECGGHPRVGSSTGNAGVAVPGWGTKRSCAAALPRALGQKTGYSLVKPSKHPVSAAPPGFRKS